MLLLAGGARAEPLGPERLASLEAWAIACPDEWEGPGGCYGRIRGEVDRLVETSRVVADLVGRAILLPELRRSACAALEPARAQAAIDEAPAWCALGSAECIQALREAQRVVGALPEWRACIERMETRVAELSRAPTPTGEAARVVAPAPAPAPTPALAPAPVPTGEAAPAPTPAPTPTPASSVSETSAPPRKVDVGRRDGQVTVGVTPFSGALTLRDPANDAEYQPMLASLVMGLEIVRPLRDDLGLELALYGRISFASTALAEAIGASEPTTVDSGTAFLVELEPSVSLLWRYLGVGLVADFRWDTLAVTSLSSGLVSTHEAGGAAGARFMAGLGMLDRELRLVGALDWLFTDGAVRAVLRAEIGAALLMGAYRQHFRLGSGAQAHVVEDLQLTLGYRAAF